MYLKGAQKVLRSELAKKFHSHAQARMLITPCAYATSLHSTNPLCKVQAAPRGQRPPVNVQFYSTVPEIDTNTFERVCEETLSSLADYFEDLVASDAKLEKGDVIYGAGVLTVDLGVLGTYVINRQSPNKQIWLSSPTSGPKRFDYSAKEDCWVYRHDGQTLHELLRREFESLLDRELNISKCAHSS